MPPTLHPLDQAIRELESRIDRLRALYEQYFMGVERIEPHVARKDVEKRIAELRKAKFQNTAKRFKFQTLVQRYNTMQQYWTRTCREIENGTYRRQKLRAERRLGSVTEAKEIAAHAHDPKPSPGVATEARQNTEQDLAAMLDANMDLEKELTAALADVRVIPPTIPGAHKARLEPLTPLSSLKRSPASTLRPGNLGKSGQPSGGLLSQLGKSTVVKSEKSSGAMSQERIHQLHQAYAAARRQTNSRDVSFEKLERKIRETETSLSASHKGKQVDFEVTIKDGKAILKPKLR